MSPLIPRSKKMILTGVGSFESNEIDNLVNDSTTQIENEYANSPEQ
jgi:hypothetical protein